MKEDGKDRTHEEYQDEILTYNDLRYMYERETKIYDKQLAARRLKDQRAQDERITEIFKYCTVRIMDPIRMVRV